MNILLCGNQKVFDGALTELLSITNKTKETVNCYIFTMDLSRLKPEYTCITDEQIKLIKKYTNKVILTFDSDLAGQQAALKIGKKLKLYDIDYWNIKLENAKDVDEFINKYGIDEFKKLLQNDDLET